jgi:hypothetical protein
MVEEMAAVTSPADIHKAADEYLETGAFLDSGMQQQAQLDLESFERATGRRLDAEQRERFIEAQQGRPTRASSRPGSVQYD